MDNRRKQQRKPLVVPLEIFTKDIKQCLGKGFVTNLNEDGIGIITAEKLGLGDELLFNFDLPNGWKFDFFGTVIHAKEGVSTMSYGVKFQEGQGTFVFRLV